MTIVRYKSSTSLSKIDFTNINKEDVISKVTDELHKNLIFTERVNDSIIFSKKIAFTTHTGENKFQIFRPLKSGIITVTETSNGSVKIDYLVSLKIQLLLSIATAIILWIVLFSDGAVELKAFIIPLKVALVLFGLFFLQNKIRLEMIISSTIKKLKIIKTNS